MNGSEDKDSRNILYRNAPTLNTYLKEELKEDETRGSYKVRQGESKMKNGKKIKI